MCHLVVLQSPNPFSFTNPFVSPSRASSAWESMRTSDAGPRLSSLGQGHALVTVEENEPSRSNLPIVGASLGGNQRDSSVNQATVEEDIYMDNADEGSIPETQSTVPIVTIIPPCSSPEHPLHSQRFASPEDQRRSDERRERRKSKLSRAGENLSHRSRLLIVGSPLSDRPDTDKASGPGDEDVDMSILHDGERNAFDDPQVMPKGPVGDDEGGGMINAHH